MKVTFLKSHPRFSYFENEQADITPEDANDLIKSGHVILFPGVEKQHDGPKADKKPFGKTKVYER